MHASTHTTTSTRRKILPIRKPTAHKARSRSLRWDISVVAHLLLLSFGAISFFWLLAVSNHFRSQHRQQQQVPETAFLGSRQLQQNEPSHGVKETEQTTTGPAHDASSSVAATALANSLNVHPDLPPAFHNVLQRSLQMRDKCQKEDQNFTGFDTSTFVHLDNETIASLPSFGVINDIQSWKPDATYDKTKWTCELPPEVECDSQKFSVIFMAYNPTRLVKTMKQIRQFLENTNWQTLVHEVVIVWNAPSHVLSDSPEGKETLKYAKDRLSIKGGKLRIVYPLEMGLVNDLMNRYNPDVLQIDTTHVKALMYYDDDGPFYSYEAVMAGFELWKRHPQAQVGAMARAFVMNTDRQQSEHDALEQHHLENTKLSIDQYFVSHCENVDDELTYQFRYFANFDANMVLPSGSFLHVNYLVRAPVSSGIGALASVKIANP
jgi:Glycosyl transferase family 64 domain